MLYKKIHFSCCYFFIGATHLIGQTFDNPGDHAIHIVQAPNLGRQSKLFDQPNGFNYKGYIRPNYGFSYDDVNGYLPNYNYQPQYSSSTNNYMNSRIPKIADQMYTNPNYFSNQNIKYTMTNPTNYRNSQMPLNYVREYNRGRTQRYLKPTPMTLSSSYFAARPNNYNNIIYARRNHFPFSLLKTLPRQMQTYWSSYQNPSMTKMYQNYPSTNNVYPYGNKDKYYWPSKRSWSNYEDYEGPYYNNNVNNPAHVGKENGTIDLDDYY